MTCCKIIREWKRLWEGGFLLPKIRFGVFVDWSFVIFEQKRTHKPIIQRTKVLRFVSGCLCLTMFGLTMRFNRRHLAVFTVLGSAVGRAFASTAGEGIFKGLPVGVGSSPRMYRVLQVQIVHRHGDRTPITPLQNESYWGDALPTQEMLDNIAATTKIGRDGKYSHIAGGRGVFGKLTKLGLLQMVELGSRLREELYAETENGHVTDESGNIFLHGGCVFHKDDPIKPNRLAVTSTDFARSLQSVQASLIGLFPDPAEIADPIVVDARHTQIMIPDPQPRQSEEQVQLEKELGVRQYLLDKEEEMRDLAVRTSEALKPLLGEGAFDINFGVGEDDGE